MQIKSSSRTAVAVFAILAVGCARILPPSRPDPAPRMDPADQPRSAADQSGPAVLALLAQADAELEAGSNSRAIAKLENALRIESRNAFVWQRLAEVHLREHRLEQAETCAERSISQARGKPLTAIEIMDVLESSIPHDVDRPASRAYLASRLRELHPETNVPTANKKRANYRCVTFVLWQRHNCIY